MPSSAIKSLSDDITAGLFDAIFRLKSDPSLYEYILADF